ncbi:MAG: helix-turn-helix domain-containing protein [Moraxella sp.]|nr:helix-turn-helix domain-containing protein [Moraxella sp.]
MSQRQAIYDYLMTGSSLNPLQALHKFNCLSLSQRISELRLHHGIPVQSILHHTKDGKKYAIYWLECDYIAKVKAGKLPYYGV